MEQVPEYDHDSLTGIIAEALSGARGPDQKRIALRGLLWIETVLSKNSDYGSSVWKRPVLSPRADVSEAIFVRMSDKVERIKQLRASGQAEVAESLEDTVADLGAYCLLWLARPHDDEGEKDA